MKGVHPGAILAIYACMFLVVLGLEDPHCFHFTWPGPTVRNKEEFSCDDDDELLSNRITPCIEPLLFCHTKPNVTEIWSNVHDDKKEENTTYVERMEMGYVCVRYTYEYNGAVMNISYFRGKVTEDKTIPVTTGCYVHYTEGYSIEACACKTKDGDSIPCNLTIKNTYSPLIILVTAIISLFVYKIFETS
ncbi:hypothetical protein PUN28_012521 [Cardiocondyla obscurior]|uniref:Uncharacterized protein n=1 Tax=Cardiocondyla obscurior TaxID=286306 RepID=A0AAW2FH83_9HYME